MDRTHVKDILPNRLEQYMKQAEQDLKLTQMNIKEKALLRSSLGCKWTRYLFQEERYKKVLFNEIDKIKQQIRLKLFQNKKQSVLNSSAATEKLITVEIEQAIKNDKNYLKLKTAVSAQQDIIRLIMQIQKQVSMLSYDISNSTNILKLQSI